MADTDLRTDRPHSARVYDYLLGGKDNYAADRAAADGLIAILPTLPMMARANRAFMHRAARYLVRSGIAQFLDVGTGIPTQPNLHQVVHEVDAAARVVYVDHDPIVLAHAAALMSESGATAYINADLRESATILRAPELVETLDLRRPVGLSLIALLHFVPDDAEVERVLGELLDALPSGSHLTITHATSDIDPVQADAAVASYRASGVPFRTRSAVEIARFFDGLELLDPGVVQVHRWKPDETSLGVADDRDISWLGAVGRKP